MVKISIQKGKKATKPKPKPRQKQKQKQSQKVVLNMGKGPQKPTHTPIYIPQSNPIMMKPQTQQSMIDLIKYLRETEGQRTTTKEKESNELEKGKEKEKKVITPEDQQISFSTIDNKAKLDFEKLIGHTPTSMYVLPTNMKASEGPHNPMSFYDSLKRRADLIGGNPNTGQLSVATNKPIEITQPSAPPASVLRHVSHPNNAALTDLLRSRLKPEQPIPEPEPQPAPTQLIEESKEETVLQESKEEDDEFFDAPEEEPQAAPEVEQQGPPIETTTNEPTQAQQLIGMDSTTTPTILKPINDVSPPTHLEDVIGEREKTGAEQSDEAIRIIQEALKPTKAASGAAAEDETGAGGGGTANTTKPPYTQDEISKMSVKDLGAIVSQVGITDDQGVPLVFNGSRVHRVTNTSYQLKKGEIAQYISDHYYPK